ncbi:MAG: class I SAM-dependent methyltransferase [Bacteroidota bacterium]|nr:class I SAM-dependent methyltransferase [Bacteroidota bacterium]
MIKKIKSYLLYNANQNNEDSISNKLRKKRLEFFLKFCDHLKKPVTILDLGGSDYHWRNSNFRNNKDYHIMIVNNEVPDIKNFRNICFIKKDVRDLEFFDDKEYDLVYSNSLLEHLNKFEEQKNLAEEIKRIGKHHFIQTPNYYFPLEPHFLFPFFQFLSDKAKTNLLLKYNLGWYGRQDEQSKALELSSSIRLLKKSELKDIFPGSQIYTEKYFFLNKSFTVYS